MNMRTLDGLRRLQSCAGRPLKDAFIVHGGGEERAIAHPALNTMRSVGLHCREGFAGGLW
jgi:hypothetical protein